jgi:hypothetical protein
MGASALLGPDAAIDDALAIAALLLTGQVDLADAPSLAALGYVVAPVQPGCNRIVRTAPGVELAIEQERDATGCTIQFVTRDTPAASERLYRRLLGRGYVLAGDGSEPVGFGITLRTLVADTGPVALAVIIGCDSATTPTTIKLYPPPESGQTEV